MPNECGTVASSAAQVAPAAASNQTSLMIEDRTPVDAGAPLSNRPCDHLWDQGATRCSPSRYLGVARGGHP
jgi:hypothetical protein